MSNTATVANGGHDNDLLQSIDTSIEKLLQYFSASNWTEFYPKIKALLKTTASSKSDEAEMLPGIEILALAYLDAPKAHTLLQDIHAIIPQIKRPIHRYTIEYFLQKGLVYWMFTRPQEFAFESQNDTPLSQIASDLFDLIYSSNNDERRRQSTWNLLGLLISFVPSAFSDMEVPKSSKSKMRSSFKMHSNKKQAYFNAINTMISGSVNQVNDMIICATKHIIKAGSILHILAPNSPIVTYSKSLYPILIPHLFAPPSRSNHVVNLPLFQATFIASFSILNPQGLLNDVYPMIKSKDEFMFYTPNILRGHINLRQIFIFSDYYTYIMDRIHNLIRIVVTETTVQLRFFESQPNFSTELSRSKIYGNYVATITNSWTIYSFDPAYFIKDYPYVAELKDDPVFLGLIDSTLSINESIEKQAIEFCMNFTNVESFKKLDFVAVPESSKAAICTWIQCGYIAEYHAQRLIEYPEIDDTAIKHLTLMKALLSTRSSIIQICKFDEICNRDPTLLETRAQRQKLSRLVETSMYICLCSSYTTVCKLALEVLNCLVQEAICIEDLSNMSASSWSIVPNFAMHSEFCSAAYVMTGTVAVQKRLYQFLQHIEMATPAILSSWKIIVVRWRALGNEIIADGSANRELLKLWRSYSGFLCSVLSPYLTENEESIVEGELSQISRDFLMEMIAHLTNVKSPYLRETARDVLSRDTSHLSYNIIFKTLEAEIGTRLESNKTLVEQDFLLLEQSVILLRSVISLINDDAMYVSLDVGTLALTIVKYLNSLASDDRVLRLKILYSHLFELVATHKDTLNMKHDLSIRNEITEIFSGWLDVCISSSFTDDSGSTVSGSTTGRSFRRTVDQRERLQKDCICAIIQAFIVILTDLRIEPPEAIHEMDLVEARTQKFASIFTQFLRILEKCHQEETGATTGSLLLGDRLATVKANTIKCASQLLVANLDVGLKFALPLGFKENTFVRTSYIKILNNILLQSSNDPNEATESQRYQELADFMTQHINITLSLCDLCPATEVDEFAKALLNIFDAKGKCLNLVKAVVTREVEKADVPLEILRRNCVATKVLSLYAHIKGGSYLRATLGPFMRDLVSDPEPYVFESNPDKIPEGESIDGNFKRFERTLHKLIGAFQSTVDEVPRELREICNTISVTAGPKFSGSKDNSVTAISAFYFLRFVCPSLVSPEAVGLLDESPPKSVRRTLLILAKIIQNMAFGSTSFVKLSIFKRHPASYGPNSTLIMQFLKSLAVIPYENIDDRSSIVTAPPSLPIEESDIDVLHRFLYIHWEDINHKMVLDQRLKTIPQNGPRNSLVDARRSTISSETDDVDFRASQKLTSLVRNLGRPRSLKKPNRNASDSSHSLQDAPRLQEFMSRNAHRDMSPIIERRVVNEGMTKEGMPLLILTLRNFSNTDFDIDLLLCRYFQIASKMWKQKFAILYDVSGFSPANALPTSSRSMIDLMAPEDMIKNCVGIYFLNVSSEFLPDLKSFIRHYYSGVFLNPTRVQYEFLTTADIASRFNISTVNLDPRTMKVNNDVRIIFNNVYRYSATRNDVTTVTVKLGNEFLQIRSQVAFNYIKTSPGFSNDIFHFSEVSDVFPSNSNGHPNEFTIQLNRGDNKQIVLYCSKGPEIVRAILNAKTRLPTKSKEVSSGLTADSSLASLLNIGFAGLCSENSETQEASYNLVASLQKRFDLDLGKTLHSGTGLRLPANVFARVHTSSKSVAMTHPELTLEMFKYLFEGFECTSIERRQGVLMYAIPWVNNIGTHVLPENTEESRKATAQIIRKFLDISLEGNRDYMYLLQSVWPIFLSHSLLIPVVIDEIVFLLIDNGIQSGPKLDDIISILTSNPSVEVCGVVLDRIDRMAQGPIESGTSMLQHSKWQEFVIHMTFLSCMLFENPAIAEAHYGELVFWLTMFIYTGPYWFRKTMYSMVVNLIHSSLYSKTSNAEKQKHAYTIWKELTASKGNMIFGISEEMKHIDYDYPVASLEFQLEMCGAILSDICSSMVSLKSTNEYRSMCTEKCLQVGSQNFSVFQCRAVLIMGNAGHLDVSDEHVDRLLEILFQALVADREEAAKEELLTCVMASVAKCSEGLRVDSKYRPLLFWIGIALVKHPNTAIALHCIRLLNSSLRNLDEYGAFKQSSLASYLMGAREHFLREWKLLEKMANFSFSLEYFEVQLVAVFTRGLLQSSTRAPTLAVIELLLSLSARNSPNVRETDTLDSGSLRGRNNSSVSIAQQHAAAIAAVTGRQDDEAITISSGSITGVTHHGKFPSYMPFLFVLFIWSRTTSELKDYLWIAGFPEEQLDGDIPSQIKAFLSSDQTVPLLCIYLATLAFRFCENEDILDSHAMACMLHLGSVNTDHFFKIYFVARTKIQNIVDSGPSLTILKSALDVAKCALCHLDDLSRKTQYIRDMDAIVSQAGMGMLAHSNNYGSAFKRTHDDTQEISKLIRKIISVEGTSGPLDGSSTAPVPTIAEGFIF